MSIEKIIEEKSKYIEASTEPTKLRDFDYAIFNGQADSVRATFDRNGIVTEKTIYRYDFKDFMNNRTGKGENEPCKILDGNIGYINMGQLQPKQTKRYLNAFKNTKAIIFDVREYPNLTWRCIANFLNVDIRPFAKFTIPDITYPGVYHYTSPMNCGKKNSNPYAGLVIILFNENTQSRAEFTVMALQTAPNVISIGSQTAGADGNASLITFPGNYETNMTGNGVYYPDGRETQRVGIVPDIEIKPTIEGLRLKRDEVLEKAIEVIKGN
ncbi:MAG: S41 family peptidase [Flavobacteriales bacterium]